MLNDGRIALSCGLLALTVLAGGCQRGPTWGLAPVEGTITKNGRPLANIEVTFLADPDAGTEGPRTTGRTDETGHYRLRTTNGDEGAVIGKHRVLIFDVEASAKQAVRKLRGPLREEVARGAPEMAKYLEEQRKAAEDASRIPPRYADFKETPLRAEVHAGPQTLDFDLP